MMSARSTRSVPNVPEAQRSLWRVLKKGRDIEVFRHLFTVKSATAREIAESTKLPLESVQAAVRNLHRSGFVRRSQDATDPKIKGILPYRYVMDQEFATRILEGFISWLKGNRS